MATERSSLLRASGGSSKLLFETTSQEELDNAIYWFELSQTNFCPDEAPMWKVGNHKPDNLGVSVSLWKALSADLNLIYVRRRRVLWIGSVIALLLSLPVCNLVFAGRWWTVAIPAAVLGIFLRHELTFTSDNWIPLSSSNNNDTSFYYAAFERVCDRYKEELASHGVRAAVMADEEGSSPQRAYLIFTPTTASEGLYFV